MGSCRRWLWTIEQERHGGKVVHPTVLWGEEGLLRSQQVLMGISSVVEMNILSFHLEYVCRVDTNRCLKTQEFYSCLSLPPANSTHVLKAKVGWWFYKLLFSRYASSHPVLGVIAWAVWSLVPLLGRNFLITLLGWLRPSPWSLRSWGLNDYSKGLLGSSG